MLENRPVWKAKSERVFLLLDRHQIWLILGFRFLYGFRTITPFLIGVSKIPPLRFLILNCIGAGVWAVIIGYLGYLFGHTIEVVIGNIKRYELWVFAFLGVAGFLLWLVYYIKRKKLIASKSA